MTDPSTLIARLMALADALLVTSNGAGYAAGQLDSDNTRKLLRAVDDKRAELESALRAALAAQAVPGEPAAFINEKVLADMHEHQRYGICAPVPTEGGSTLPLYTASPAAPKPLTDEQIVEIRDEHLPNQGE